MDWQTLIVYSILAAAFLFIARRVWQRLRAFSNSNGNDCATGCGKCGTEISASKSVAPSSYVK